MDRQTQQSQQTVKMPVDLETIEAIKNLCMVKFYASTSQDISELGNIHFDYDGSMHWVCSRTIPKPLKVRDAGIIFEVYGKISGSDCQLFERRGEEKDFEDEDILASCWIEPCSDALQEQTHWRNFRHSLEDIIAATGRSLDTSNLYTFDAETKVMRLKVVWAAVPGWRELVRELRRHSLHPLLTKYRWIILLGSQRFTMAIRAQLLPSWMERRSKSCFICVTDQQHMGSNICMLH